MRTTVVQHRITKMLVRIGIIALVVTFSSNFNIAYSQDSNKTRGDKKYEHRSTKKKERVDIIKQLKMLEALNLDESKSATFIAKLSNFDKRISENRKSNFEANRSLCEAITNNNKQEMIKLANQIVVLQDEFGKLNSDKTKEIKGVLNEEEFAKYVHFENKFMREFFGTKMEGKNKNAKKNKGKKSKSKKQRSN